MHLFYRNGFRIIVAGITLIMLSSCVTLPKMETLQPLPEYPPDAGGWQTSTTCVIVADGTHIPVEDIAKRMESEGYTISFVPSGYLTRQKRISVSKALVVESYYAVPLNFSDGSCVDSKIKITIHDTASLQKSGPFEAQARSITQAVDLKSKPGGKELLKEIKNDPEKVSKVPELLGKDPQSTTAVIDKGKILVTEGNVFEDLMNNLLCQPEVRLALTPAS